MKIVSEGLTKYYGKRKVVNNVDLNVNAGEVVGLLGPNGAGKTTTFYMIVGLIKPNEGRVLLNNDDVTGLPMYQRARKGIGYLPQEPSVFKKLTVEENILAILETIDVTREERQARLESLMQELNIQALAKNKAYSLSGGERRRVEISRALVTSPSFLLLDEPFTGIDPIAIGEIQEIIRHLQENGMGILISDHNYQETLSICDRSYILDKGEVVEEGDTKTIYQSPKARKAYLGNKSASKIDDITADLKKLRTKL
jgi:lipopolysaccharide export system ATP-binding protein